MLVRSQTRLARCGAFIFAAFTPISASGQSTLSLQATAQYINDRCVGARGFSIEGGVLYGRNRGGRGYRIIVPLRDVNIRIGGSIHFECYRNIRDGGCLQAEVGYWNAGTGSHSDRAWRRQTRAWLELSAVGEQEDACVRAFEHIMHFYPPAADPFAQ